VLTATEEALQRITGLLDVLQCGAMLVDRRGRIVHANERLCQLVQRPRSAVDGRLLHEFYPEGEGRDRIHQVLANFSAAVEQEFYLPRADGSRLPIVASGRQLSGPPPLCDHRVVTVIDISQQKRAEQELHERYRDIAQLSDTVLEQALALKDYSRTLEQRVRDRTRDLHEANMDAIYMLAVASEAKDADTGAHVRRIQYFAEALARELGLRNDEAERIGYSAILHDVGKMQIPDQILKKPESLTDPEWAEMRQHTLVGERILAQRPFFDLARQIARSHHENWDGSGYPDGLKGQEIPLAARIVRLADVYDALISERPYKPAWRPEQAAEAIQQGCGTLFDPAVTAAFLRLFEAGRLDPELVRLRFQVGAPV
jgi:putative nucleotidyltransferase with HDIG domain/PAS domain S-box-containing protein